MRSEIDKFVIQKVREIRLKKGISQSKLAFEMNKSQGFIGQVESSRYDVCYNIEHLNEIARILECSPQEFWPTKPL